MTEQWELTKGQQRIVTALVHQRQEVVTAANQTLGEIGAALQEVLEMVAAAKGLDAKEVDFADGEVPGEIVLKRKDAASQASG